MVFGVALAIGTAAAIIAPYVAEQVTKAIHPEYKQAQKAYRGSDITRRSGVSMEQRIQQSRAKVEQAKLKGGVFAKLPEHFIYGLGLEGIAFGRDYERQLKRDLGEAGYSEAVQKEVSEGAGAVRGAVGVTQIGSLIGISAGAEVLGRRLAARGVQAAIAKGGSKTGKLAVTAGRPIQQQAPKWAIASFKTAGVKKASTQITTQFGKISKKNILTTGKKVAAKAAAKPASYKAIVPFTKKTPGFITRHAVPGIAVAGAYEGGATSIASQVARKQYTPLAERPDLVEAGIGAGIGSATAAGLGGLIVYKSVAKGAPSKALYAAYAMDPYEWPGDVIGSRYVKLKGKLHAKYPGRFRAPDMLKVQYPSGFKTGKITVPSLTPVPTTLPSSVQTPSFTPTPVPTQTTSITPSPTDTPTTTPVLTPTTTPTPTTIPSPTPQVRGIPPLPFLGGPGEGPTSISRTGKIKYYDERAAAGATFRGLL